MFDKWRRPHWDDCPCTFRSEKAQRQDAMSASRKPRSCVTPEIIIDNETIDFAFEFSFFVHRSPANIKKRLALAGTTMSEFLNVLSEF